MLLLTITTPSPLTRGVLFQYQRAPSAEVIQNTELKFLSRNTVHNVPQLVKRFFDSTT